METTALYKKAKGALRISNNNEIIEEDINDSTDAAIKDLINAGVIHIDDKNPLIIKAVKSYVRAEFNYLGKGEEFKKSYDEIKSQLMLSVNYNKLEPAAEKDEAAADAEG